MQVTLLVDAVTARLSGIGRYTWELSQRLPARPEIDDVAYFANGRFIEDAKWLHETGNRRRRTPLPRWLRRGLHRRRLRNSLVHGPNYFLPDEAETGIITVHDLSVMRFPETHPPERVKTFERSFGRSLERAKHLITDTQTVRTEIIEELGVPADRVTAIPLGVGAEFRPRTNDELQPELAKLGLLPGGYGLCVSTIEPRKKIAELLRAWSNLPLSVREATPLVLAGCEGWLNDSLHHQIENARSAGWLKYLGFVPDEALPSLYSGAALFAYPSIYEGFGLPPVEAMASGVPVLVGNRSCLPEVCGDAAAYVDPENETDFARTLREALEDSEWQARARLRGLARAAEYSWDRCVSQTVEVYSAVNGDMVT